MVGRVKSYKAGFVKSDSNIKPDNTLEDILNLKEKTGHSTVAVTEDGTAVSVRPSGTEPKIKFYFGVKAPLASVADFDRVQAELDAKIEGIKKDLKLE